MLLTEISKLFKDEPGKKILMSGNEAFARGIFEAGVKFSANYPGTPLSEVGDLLKYLSETDQSFTFDYALNEKIALESCIGVSWAGLRSVAMFKHVGLNVAADPLHTFPYSGTNGGMLIICGGDPGILSSTNAQDNRFYSLHTKIPIIEPSTVQECKTFVIEGLKLSEVYQIPIYIHVTTRLCHSQGIVEYGSIEKHDKMGRFEKNPTRYVNTLWKAKTNQQEYYKKISQLAIKRDLFETFNSIKWSNSKNSIGVVSSGICYSYVVEACHALEIQPPILKLGLIYPINRAQLIEFAQKFHLETILVVEELEPFLELCVKEAFWKFSGNIKNINIHGKDFLPKTGELGTEQVIRFLANHFNHVNKEILSNIERKESALVEIIPSLPIREPTFCPGCQYRPVFYQLKKVVTELGKTKGWEFIYSGDIGCYTLSEAYPYQMLDWVVCMGAGIGIAQGMVHAINPEKQKLIAFIGDGTFFHSGIQPLLNALKNDLDITILLFNNDWTAMTGHQEHLATPRDAIKHFGTKSSVDKIGVDLISILENLGIKNLVITDAYDLHKLERIFSNTLQKKGIKVIIIKEECTLEKYRRLKRQPKGKKEQDIETYYTLSESCVKCNECIDVLGCPAINAKQVRKDSDDNDFDIFETETIYYIDEARCVPEICPGVCKMSCPNNMIRKTTILRNLKDN